MGGPPWSPWCLLPNGRYPGYLHCLVDDGPQKLRFFQGQLPEGQPSLLNLLHFFWGQHPTMTTLPSWTYLEFFCHGFPVPFHGDSEKQFGQPIWTTTSSLLRTTPCCDNTAILNVLGFLESCIPVPFHSNSERHLGQPASNDREESPEGKFLSNFWPSFTGFYKGPVCQQWIALIQVFFYQLFDYWQHMGDAPPSRPRPSRHQDIFYPNIFII